MKTLKITLLIAVLFGSLMSCTKQDLNEDEVLTYEEFYAEDETGDQGDD